MIRVRADRGRSIKSVMADRKSMKNKTIKLISLNTWAGRALHPLMRFFKKYGDDMDIFCLQEVHDIDQKTADERHPEEHICGPLFKKILTQLPDFESSFAFFDDDKRRMSLAVFMRRGLPIKTIEDFIVYKPEQPKEVGSLMLTARKLQYVTLNFDGIELLIANYHGLWNGGPKTDTPERIEQSEKIKSFLDEFSGPKILCGDFNLLPDTKSISILEKGMRNLVKEYGIASTRTLLYRHYDKNDEPNFADYIFLTPNIEVVDFKVLPDVVSDHSPLYLEFSY